MAEKEIHLIALKNGNKAADETTLTGFEDDEEQRALPKGHVMSADKDEEDPTPKQDSIDGINDENDEEDISKALSMLLLFRRACKKVVLKNSSVFTKAFKIIFFIGICVYLGFAFHHSFGDEQSLTLLGLVCFAVGYFIISRCFRKYKDRLKIKLGNLDNSRFTRILKLVYW